jgi:hypothetical protein
MRAMVVVMLHELAKHPLKLTVAEDQYAVEAFSANGADEALGDAVGPRCLHRSADDPNAFGTEDLVEASRELGVSVR